MIGILCYICKVNEMFNWKNRIYYNSDITLLEICSLLFSHSTIKLQWQARSNSFDSKTNKKIYLFYRRNSCLNSCFML